MESVKVSVIIPCYNYGTVVAQAISSSLKQTYKNVEIIVVNDGSTDNSDQVISSFGDEICYINQHNQGVARARNSGAKSSCGDWLLFLDADDMLYPEAIQHLVSQIDGTQPGVVFGKIRVRRKSEWVEKYYPNLEGPPPHPASLNFYNTVIVTPGAAIVKRTVFEEVGGFESNLHPVEDRHFWLKCGVVAPYRSCDADILEKRIHPGCASWNVDRMIYKRFIVQLDFLNWCQRNDIDHTFISDDLAKVAEKNVIDGIWYKAWDGMLALILHAKYCKISTAPLERCCKLLKLSSFLPDKFLAWAITKILS